MHRHPSSSRGFTLIELLVVIAIIAILAVVVVLTLNPAQLLAQSRDANRVADMATLNTALGLFQTDSGGIGFMGTSTVIYTSLADNVSSTCGSLGLPALPTGYIYDCSPSTSTRNTNSAGWIPIDFTKISAGTPLGSLPIDPTNSSSTGLYYTYNTGGNNQFMVTAIPESQKQKTALGQSPMILNYPDVIANGSNLTINPLFSTTGLVAYWPMDEGVGGSSGVSQAADKSGNNYNGTWWNAPAGTNGTYYATGKVGPYAGVFSNVTGNVVEIPIATNQTGAFTISLWINPTSWTSSVYENVFGGGLAQSDSAGLNVAGGAGLPGGAVFQAFNATGRITITIPYNYIPVGTWTLVNFLWDGSASVGALRVYANGVQIASSTGPVGPLVWTAFPKTRIGGYGGGGYTFPGSLDDFRIYNRALSAAEIAALYNAAK